jgi:PAS domain S-box-containing protein
MSDTPHDSAQPPTDAEVLRQRAETHVRSMELPAPATQTPEQIQLMLHELRVHQIELEMQNEELRTAQAAIEAGRARYFDLYDLAPVGYCTLSEKGLILEANLTAAMLLNTARSGLVKQPISRFIFEEDQDIYYRHRKLLFETGESQKCELRLLKPEGTFFWAHLTGITAQAEDGATVCRLVLANITDRKKAEEEIRKQLSEKEILLREVHHRVKNNIANIQSLLSLQAGSTANVEVKAALQEAISRVQSMRVLYEKLLSSDTLHEVSIKNYMEDLIDSLVMAYDPGKCIAIEKKIEDFRIEARKAFFAGIIVNELLTNVFKYAFRHREKGRVSVSIDKEEGSMTLIIQDNGNGFDERALDHNSPGFGHTIVRMLAEQLDGTYSSGNEDGARSVVRFGI